MAHKKNVTPLVYRDQVSIHGIPDLIKSPTVGMRIFWLVVMLLAFIAMVAQAANVAQHFASDAVGFTVSPYVPSRLPGILFCPRYHALKPFEESGIDDDMARTLGGYIPFSTEFYRHQEVFAGKKPNPATNATVTKLETAIRSRSGDNSMRFVMDNAMSPGEVVLKTEVQPFFEKAVVTTLLTSHGLCYFVEASMDVTNVAEYVWLLATVNSADAARKTDALNTIYTVHIGQYDTVAVNPPVSGMFFLSAHNIVAVKARVTKNLVYPGRNGKRCRKYRQSDQNHCVIKAINDKCKRCDLPIPASHSYAEVVCPVERSCNFYIADRYPCALQMTGEDFDDINQQCPTPCVNFVFEYTQLVSPSTNETRVDLTLDNLAFSVLMEEYALITLVDFLSAVGGTVGLYFGASLLSIVQFGFYACYATASSKICQRERGLQEYRWT